MTTARRAATRPAAPAAALLAAWTIGAAGAGAQPAAAPAVGPAPARSAAAPPKFLLLPAEGEPRPVGLVSLTAGAGPGGARGEVTVVEDSQRRTIPLAGVIALAPLSWLDPPADPLATLDAGLPAQRVELVDGQRFVGRMTSEAAGGTADAETVRFTHDRLGGLAFPLERLGRFTAEPARAGAAVNEEFTTATDTLLLANGDRLEGLIERFGQTVRVDASPLVGAPPTARPGAPARPKPRAEPVEVDLDQVLVANLVNPPARMAGSRVDLTDGSVVAAAAVSGAAEGARLSVTPSLAPAGAPPTALGLGDLAGLVPDASRVTPLAALPIAAQSRAPGRLPGPEAATVNAEGAPLGAADVLIPGPMRVEWELPRGASRVVGALRLEERALAWGDCTAVVSVVPGGGAPPGAEREIARAALNASTPVAPLAVDLGEIKVGDRLRVRVEAGPRGPIQDRVLLRRVLILHAATAGGR